MLLNSNPQWVKSLFIVLKKDQWGRVIRARGKVIDLHVPDPSVMSPEEFREQFISRAAAVYNLF
jgi:hypothetical protein